MSYRIGMAAAKGGAGKTALSIGLSAEALERGHRVALGDLDPLGVAHKWARLAAHRGLPAPRASGFDEHVEGQLARLGPADLTILDTAGDFDARLDAALDLVDVALLPVKPEVSDIWVLRETIRVVRARQDLRPPRRPLRAYVVLCCADRSTLTRRTAAALAECELPSLRTVLRASKSYSKAQEEGLGITTYAPTSGFADDMRALLDELLALKKGGRRAAA